MKFLEKIRNYIRISEVAPTSRRHFMRARVNGRSGEGRVNRGGDNA